MGEAYRGDVCELQLILGTSCYNTPCVTKAITAASQQIVARESPRTASCQGPN